MVRWGSQGELARELHVTPQRVGVVLKSYRGRRNKSGKLNLDHAKQWYEEHTQQARRKKPESSTNEQQNSDKKIPSYLESQAKKEAALARIKELEADEKEAKLIPVDVSRKLYTKLGQSLKNQLEQMDDRFTVQLEAKGVKLTKLNKKKIQEALRTAHAEILTSFQTFKME